METLEKIRTVITMLARLAKPLVKKLWLALKIFVVFSIFWVILYRFANPPTTMLMLQRGYVGKGNIVISNYWVPYEKISLPMKQAVIAAEDANFLTHHGFDFSAIKKAYSRNSELGKDVYGASTISQQTARNVFLWSGRSWLRKGLEAYFTALIELFWNKKRILEVYLNVIEFGDGIFGVQAAAIYYYNLDAEAIKTSEACLMAAALPFPRTHSPINPSELLRSKSMIIEKKMGKLFRNEE